MSHSILVIDDEEPIRISLMMLLRVKGYAVSTAGNGREGLESFIAGRPQLVLTDIIMPGHEGIETIMKIKEIDPHARIIAMSGGGRVGGRDFLDLAREIGADGCLEKPFDTNQLLALVQRLLPNGG